MDATRDIREIEGRKQYDDDGNEIVRLTTCGECGQTWNDAIISAYTPAPSGRCPFEDEHEEIRAETEDVDATRDAQHTPTPTPTTSRYVVTVHLLLPFGPEKPSGYAEDAVSAMLTENLEGSGALQDWAYVMDVGGTHTAPRVAKVPDDYTEGSFVNAAENPEARAANAHDALVEALEVVQQAIANWRDNVQPSADDPLAHVVHPEHGPLNLEEVKYVLVDAALALARQEASK